MNKLDCGEKSYKIVCITQIYNEIRKQNLERFWDHINSICDALVVYDDGSTDGSYEYMLDKAAFIIRAGENDFKNEVNHKKILLQYALKLQPDFILWLDADEVLTANAKEELPKLCKYADENNIDGISFHEINLWRSYSWKRIDNSYDLGWFVRLWRVTPNLMFKETTSGLHQQQYPNSIKEIEKTDSVGVIHYGFATEKSLAFKYLTYRSHGQNGWALERLLDEGTLTLEKVDKKLFPEDLYINDDKPIPRSFIQAISSLDVYKEEVFKPRISIVCLIYKSTDWLQFVYEQVLKYTDLNDKEFYFVANDANESVLQYLNNNYIPHYVWNNSDEQKKEWYINNVYRAWNFAAQKAKGDYLLFINSDMAFSHGWVENLFNKLNGKNCVASRLVESGKLLSGEHAISKNFGRFIEDFDETAFNTFAEEIKVDELKDGGLFMPLLIKKDDFLSVGGYPEGNIVPGTNIFTPQIALKGTQCISGDVVLMQKLKEIGINHTTSYDSIIYHFQCGEMDSHSTLPNNVNEKIRVIICNDYLSGRMGERTMWNFLLSNLPNSVGVDKDSLNADKDFEKEAKLYIKKNYPESDVIIQNATFMDLIDRDRFNILYLQDNLRAMGRKSLQQEANLKQADILVTNSNITAASYPEYNFEIIPIGIDDNLFKPMDKKYVRKEFDIPNQSVGIFVGDFSEVKGWSKVKSLIENHDEIFWIIVSKDENTYERKNTKVFNRISQEKLVKLLNCADFFILGSPVETQCLSALEACFCNLPIIMNNTGIFADFSDEEKEKIGYFGEDFEAGLKKVLNQQFSPREIMYQKNLTIYGMVEKWKKLISKARLNSEQNILRHNEERHPFFSVIVPTFNQAEFLGEALDSLLNQTFRNWEAIIVNDGSSDNTKEVIDKYLSIDKRFRAFHKENGGVASALNIGIQNAKGDWICWLSSDDLFEPDKLETHFEAINKNPEIKFFHTHWYLLLDESKQKIAPPLWLAIPPTEFQVTRFFWANYVHGNAIAVNRTVFEEVGLFDESLRQGQDFEMWLRISSKYVSFYIDKRTCVTRIHKGQTTNSFVEGGVLDSTRALIKFLNEVSFRELFPFTDLQNPNNIIKVLNEIIFISTKENAFIYRCGFTTALAEKTMEWLTNEIPIQFSNKLFPILKTIVKGYFEQPLSEDIKSVLKLFLNKDRVTYKQHNFIFETKQFVNKLILTGDQNQAKAIEKYLLRILNLNTKYENSDGSYEPILLGYPNDNKFKKIEPSDINHWTIEPGRIETNSIKQRLNITCKNCTSNYNISLEYEMGKDPTVQEFICPKCKNGYKFDDENFDLDFIEFHNRKVSASDSSISDSSKVAFFIRDASVVGGGTKILFKYIDWLSKLGTNITVYSFAKKPDWIETKLNYIQIQSELEIKTIYKLLFVFSIFDVPLVLNRIPISKVVHICQGYEGYHFGRDYEELRSDKHILTKMHAIPVKNITVSTHLVELFRDKFSRETFYIPNGIDHNVFSPDENIKREKSVLFVGNPFHPLKGFDFLGSSIKRIQSSSYKIENLKLIIVMGFKPDNIEKIISHISEQLDCTVEIKYKLSSKEIAELMRSVGLVVCTSWYEGFSMPLLEAMATGTPVITTYNLGAQSFCKEGFNSFNVKYGDVNHLAQTILNVLFSSIDISNIIINAYKTSLEYSEYNSVNHFINVIEELLSIKFNTQIKEKLINEYVFNDLTTNEKLSKELRIEKPLVSIIIPVFNQLEYTKKCIESLVSTIEKKVELIIVDNASTDRTPLYLKTYKNDKLKLIMLRNEENHGFPKAVNRGILESSGKFIIIANNDIIFTDKCINRMLEVAESDERIGIVGPISNEVSGVQRDKEANYKTIDEMHRYADKVREKNNDKILHFPRVAFLCTLIKKEVIDKIGGLDERFSPGNFEDDDFCLRAQLAGFKTVIANDVFIHHYGSKSFKANGLNEYQKRLDINRQKFVEKWGATPEEIWLENKSIKNRNVYFPIHDDLFKQYFDRTRIYLADDELNLAQESIVQAIENYKEGNTQLIQYDELLNLAANIFLAVGDLSKAQNYFEQELQTNPQSSSACFGLGQIFFTQENYEAAKTMFEWAIKNDEANLKAKEALQNVNEILGLDVNHNSLVEM
ncbi:MAG: glycosyltransferase [Stygiobacter sp.]